MPPGWFCRPNLLHRRTHPLDRLADDPQDEGREKTETASFLLSSLVTLPGCCQGRATSSFLPGDKGEKVASGVSTAQPGRGRGSRASRFAKGQLTGETALARLVQAAGQLALCKTTSEPETALPLTNERPDAGAAQRRPGAEHQLDLTPEAEANLSAVPTADKRLLALRLPAR